MAIFPQTETAPGSVEGIVQRLIDHERRLRSVEAVGATLGPGSVGAGVIAPGSVTGGVGGMLAVNTLTALNVVTGTLTAATIQTGTLTATQIQADSLTAAVIAADAITANELAANAVYANSIQSGAVTAAKISVSDLSAISANLGSITFGVGTGSIRTAASGARMEFDNGGIRAFDSGGTNKTFEILAGSGQASFTGVAVLDPNSVVPSASFSSPLPGDNYLPNSSFEQGVDSQTSIDQWAEGWQISGGTGVKETTLRLEGNNALKVTATAANDIWVGRVNTAGDRIRIRAGSTYTFTGYTLASTTGRAVRIDYYWYDSNQTLIAGGSGSGYGWNTWQAGNPSGTAVLNGAVTQTSNNTSWTRHGLTLPTAPATAVFLGIAMRLVGAANGEIHYFDSFQLEDGDAVSAYHRRSTEILYSSLRAAFIGSGEIKANHIAAGAITAGSISVRVGSNNVLNNSSFEDNNGGVAFTGIPKWIVPDGATASRVTSQSVDGAASVQLTSTNTATAPSITSSTVGTAGSLVAGTYYYKVTARAAGSTETSGSNEVSAVVPTTYVAKPTAASASATTGGALAPGTYYYVVSAVTAAGETLPSTEFSVTIPTSSASAPTPGATPTVGTAGAMPSGTYYYKITALNAVGETAPSTEVSGVIPTNQVSQPGAVTPTVGTAGALPAATYYYRVTAYNSNGETTGTTEVSAVVPLSQVSQPGAVTPTVGSAGAMAAGTYYYRVTGYNANGDTTPTTEVSAVIPLAQVAQPASPSLSTSFGLRFNELRGCDIATRYYKVTATNATGETTAGSILTASYTSTLYSGAPPTATTTATTNASGFPAGTYEVIYQYIRFALSDANYPAIGASIQPGDTSWDANSPQMTVNDQRSYDSAASTALVLAQASTISVTIPTSPFQDYAWCQVRLRNTTTATTYYPNVSGKTYQKEGTTVAWTLSDVTTTSPGTTGGTVPYRDGKATISWTASTGATGYKVYRSTDNGVTWEGYFNDTASPYIDPYKVFTNGVASTSAPPTTNTATRDLGSVALAFSASTGSPTGYHIFRGTATGTNDRYYTTATNSYTDVESATYTASTILPPVTNNAVRNIGSVALAFSASTGTPTGYHVYRGTAAATPDRYFTTATNSYTDIQSATFVAATSVPTTNTANRNNGSIDLTWSAVSGATGYRVYRGTSAGGENVSYAPGNVTAYSDVFATNYANGAPPSSGSATANVGRAAITFTAPTGPGAAGVTGYRIYRSTSPGAQTTYQTNASSPFNDDGGAGTAGTPISGAATAVANVGSVALAWSTVSGATSYRLYRGTAAAGENIYTYDNTTPSFTDIATSGTAGTPPATNNVSFISDATLTQVARVTPSQPYFLSSHFRPGSISALRTYYVKYDWYTSTDGSGSVLSSNTLTPATVTAGAWNRLSLQANAPSTAASVKVTVGATGLSSAETFFVDGVQLEQGDLMSAYGPRADEVLTGQIGSTEIGPGSISTGHILALDLGANQVTASSLAAIEATLGNVTAGTITAVTISSSTFTTSTSTAFARVIMDPAGIRGYDANNTTTPWFNLQPGSFDLTRGTLTGATFRTAAAPAARMELNSTGLWNYTGGTAWDIALRQGLGLDLAMQGSFTSGIASRQLRWLDGTSVAASLFGFNNSGPGTDTGMAVQSYGGNGRVASVFLNAWGNSNYGASLSNSYAASIAVSGTTTGGVIRFSAGATSIMDFNQRGVLCVGGDYGSIGQAGDINTRRSSDTGTVYFGDDGNAYLYYNRLSGASGGRTGAIYHAGNGTMALQVGGHTYIGDVGHGNSWAGFAHWNCATPGGYALLSSINGDNTLVNVGAGGRIRLRINNEDYTWMERFDFTYYNSYPKNAMWRFPSARGVFFQNDAGSGGVNIFQSNTSWGSSSDESLKKDIAPMTSGLSLARQITLKEYRFNWEPSYKPIRYGVIAQELRSVMPGSVYPSGDNLLSVLYQDLIPIALAAVKEVDTTVVALSATVTAQAATIAAQATTIAAHTATIATHTSDIAALKSAINDLTSNVTYNRDSYNRIPVAMNTVQALYAGPGVKTNFDTYVATLTTPPTLPTF